MRSAVFKLLRRGAPARCTSSEHSGSEEGFSDHKSVAWGSAKKASSSCCLGKGKRMGIVAKNCTEVKEEEEGMALNEL